jgi:serine/threonine protein kinase
MSLPLLLEPGTLLDGRYIVGQLINHGGFGAVYRGIDTSEDDRPCAIKETYDVSPAARRQALMQAGILFTVKSKHLPQVYDAFEANQRFYLVMQLIEGQTLLQLLRARGHPCSEQQVTAWLLPIIHILQELHSRTPAVIHRDIKPGNIILTPDQTAVLVDFGLTKLHDPDSNTQTIIRAVSEGFSPVEQYTGKTGPQSDIYSLAATMYFLLTNKIPPLAINRSIQDEIIAPRLLNPALSPKIERVLLKALAVDPDQRYQSMREFAQALQEPGFTGYADPTVASTGAQSASTHTTSVGLSTPSSLSINMQHIPPPPPPPFPLPRPTSPPQIQPSYHTPSSPIYPAPAPNMAAAPPGYVLVLWIVLGIVVVLLLVCGGGFVLLFYLGTHNGATDAANQYYTAIEKQDYNTAFTYLDASNLTLNSQGLTQSLYIQGARLFDQTKGKLTAYSITNTSLNSNNGVNTAMLTVSETRNGAPYDVHVQLKQESSGWKITSLDNF